ncbi:MAG: PhzF family phenazine biosynthesis protein [Acidothermus cellulolyticus]|nr:PhzF family phenazine biosynthesis protein [Acidothermus cellulolyticus]
MTVQVLRYAAFTTTPSGGNPAGVVLDAADLDAAAMQRIAAEVGYSETAFLSPRFSVPHSAGSSPSSGFSPQPSLPSAHLSPAAHSFPADGGFAVRYFTPQVEVPFCGHATIAAGVVLGERYGEGRYRLHAPAGPIDVDVARDADGYVATLTSVTPSLAPLPDAEPLLAALRWSASDLDPQLPPRVAFAGLHHPVLAAATRARLADLHPDLDALAAVMHAAGWSTVQLVWRETPTVFWSRNPAPAVGIAEDPATGSAAAAFGHYLRELGLVDVPATVTIHQGDDLGRPSVLVVHIGADDPRIRVAGHAVPIDDPA